ncbi:hypothetical protein SAMN05444392_1192 [Seinonella peptonophila]|uniref:Uncharacterized protein n=1 Tax=Seinonella peptonophila TaxID=112248 RepID=A0A1M5B6P3_9BACL|nr:hypothetical protein SAMN05444392_1192 [Seinonella peptonophila]
MLILQSLIELTELVPVESYSMMVARTKVMQAQFEGTINESLKRDALYCVISFHNFNHASCRKWEGILN